MKEKSLEKSFLSAPIVVRTRAVHSRTLEENPLPPSGMGIRVLLMAKPCNFGEIVAFVTSLYQPDKSRAISRVRGLLGDKTSKMALRYPLSYNRETGKYSITPQG
jgi:hypothetical protein